MARKSRKAGNCSSGGKPEAKNRCLVGFYLRLSDKEIKDGNSESIENQRALLADFIKDKPDFHLISTFIDDGKTGTNFRRDGFEQMMEEVKNGSINCVMVKDLSRFGRNYLEAGHYIEYVFPFLNVRFIAVTDNFDTLTATAAQLSYLIPLKNIMNENYAKDISKKERSAKKMLRKNGCFLGAYAMYGYEKTADKHRISIDPEAANHVKTIFDLCEQGYSDSAIAKYLNFHHIACPARYKYEKGIVKNEKYANTSGWYPQTVAGILTSRVYIGDMVQGKRGSREIRGKKEVIPRSQWDIVSGTHEPIISKEQFERIQKIRLDRHERYQRMTEKRVLQEKKPADANILKGKVYCGDCKKAMVRKHIKSCRDEYRYICEAYERNGRCTRKFLPENDLYEMLSCMVKKQAETLRQAACHKEYLLTQSAPASKDCVWLNEKQQGNEELLEFDWRLSETEGKRNRFLKGKASLYQDWKEGILNKEEYFYMKKHYEQELLRCKEERHRLLEERSKYIVTCTGENPARKAASGMSESYRLSKNLADRLLERIEVYGGNRVVVHFKFQDEFEQLLKKQGVDG